MTTLELAERCENANGPDAELDWLIIDAMNPDARWAYTSSVDAALTLVPEGWHTGAYHQGPSGQPHRWILRTIRDGETFYREAEAKARSAALAICAAALRARHGDL